MSDDALKPPVARYRLTLEITANTSEEIIRELQIQADSFEYGFHVAGGVDFVAREQVGGRHVLRLTEPNPEMTPERYDAELLAWHDETRRRRNEP